LWRGRDEQMIQRTTLSDALYARIVRLAKAGVLERVAQAWQHELLAQPDLETLLLESTIVTVHAHASYALRNGGAKRSAILGAA
jgi:hypothetical protein